MANFGWAPKDFGSRTAYDGNGPLINRGKDLALFLTFPTLARHVNRRHMRIGMQISERFFFQYRTINFPPYLLLASIVQLASARLLLFITHSHLLLLLDSSIRHPPMLVIY